MAFSVEGSLILPSGKTRKITNSLDPGGGCWIRRGQQQDYFGMFDL
jgi:hypothetical protein